MRNGGEFQTEEIVGVCPCPLRPDQGIARIQHLGEVIDERTHDGGRVLLVMQHRELRRITNATATQLTQQDNNATNKCARGRERKGRVEKPGDNSPGAHAPRGVRAFQPSSPKPTPQRRLSGTSNDRLPQRLPRQAEAGVVMREGESRASNALSSIDGSTLNHSLRSPASPMTAR